jgi:hypothetical protein
MKKIVWFFVISWIEKNYAKKDTENSSAIVDCCLFLKEAL